MNSVSLDGGEFYCVLYFWMSFIRGSTILQKVNFSNYCKTNWYMYVEYQILQVYFASIEYKY